MSQAPGLSINWRRSKPDGDNFAIDPRETRIDFALSSAKKAMGLPLASF
ncbi:MAG TPA: hypothetical protein VNM37_21815 [Candidatus Dormibacteraeota bacterium]|nr:hypothetical protein [Candidatus Dormibacteraeota bacterium]